MDSAKRTERQAILTQYRKPSIHIIPSIRGKGRGNALLGRLIESLERWIEILTANNDMTADGDDVPNGGGAEEVG